ncbi:MAG: DUF3048 domain-containing protein [Lachnospiraceae bacterium]|nr:DUF3048 domain-containing protein [Lachnospiraceae bacterium]
MKKRLLSIIFVTAMACTFAACGEKEDDVELVMPVVETIAEDEAESNPESEEYVKEDAPEGMYWSELSGLAIDESIKNQKPIAAMVDNEIKALPHFGVNEADIVYELMNSTANDRVTRFMVVYKDWGNIEQLGSIRSTRPTNIPLASEYNAVLCHDGGPFYIDAYLAKDYAQHFSGIFSRVNNGKAREFTEYICEGDLDKAFSGSKYSTEYDQYYSGEHFTFSSPSRDLTLDSTMSATKIDLAGPFKHNKSRLDYDESTGLYTYSEYGNVHVDGKTGEALTFKNVILQKCSYAQLDDHGYLVYNYLCSDWDGYYITNGKAIKIKWSKTTDTEPTRFYTEDGVDITLNAGKTYIAIVPDDHWDEMVIE